MKPITLLLLRLSTGIYLVLWGVVKLAATDMANSVSDRYYSGVISGEVINLGLGSLQVLVGILVIIGFARSISYVAQLLWYLAGIIPIMGYIIDPFGRYLVDTAKLTFFPSTTLLFASLIMIVFRDHDTLSVDAKRQQGS